MWISHEALFQWNVILFYYIGNLSYYSRKNGWLQLGASNSCWTRGVRRVLKRRSQLYRVSCVGSNMQAVNIPRGRPLRRRAGADECILRGLSSCSNDMNILPITPRHLARRDDIFSKLQRETTKGNNSLACPTYKQKNQTKVVTDRLAQSKGW